MLQEHVKADYHIPDPLCKIRTLAMFDRSKCVDRCRFQLVSDSRPNYKSTWTFSKFFTDIPFGDAMSYV